MEKNVLKMLALCILIREIFSFWTGHPWDFEVWVRVGYYVANGVNPYTLLDPMPGLSFSGYSTMPSIGYPPLWAFICASMYKLYASMGYPSRFIYYFLLKQPAIFGDALTAYSLHKFISRFGGGERALYAIKFWAFCPFTILISSIWGMFDGFAVGLVLSSLLLLSSSGRWKWSSFLLGLSVFLKLLPAIYIPILALFKDLRRRSSFASLSISIPLLLSILPFAIYGWDLSGFFNCVSSQATKYPGLMTFWSLLEYIQYSTLGATSAFKLSLSLLSLIWAPTLSVFYLTALRSPRFNLKELIQALLITTCLLLLTRLVIPEQFAIYPMALALIDACLWHPRRLNALHAIWILASIYAVINNTLLIRFLSPVSIEAFNLDIAINNNLPTAQIRYLLMHASATIYSIVILRYFLKVWRESSTSNTTRILFFPRYQWRSTESTLTASIPSHNTSKNL